MKRKKDNMFGVIGPVIAITSSFSQLPLSIIVVVVIRMVLKTSIES